ncbi:hypothetical protein BG004_007574 [Podila humilis]|nr:hypothetical protein BG004_007574 [Podila humilis]
MIISQLPRIFALVLVAVSIPPANSIPISAKSISHSTLASSSGSRFETNHIIKRAVIPIAGPPSLTPKQPPAKTVTTPTADIEILNPSPNDVWVSGTLETISWDAMKLPSGATIDISFIPVDPKTNPKAEILTRRPFARKIHALNWSTDVVVPYNLLTMGQLEKEQEGEGLDAGLFVKGVPKFEGGSIPTEEMDLDHRNETMTIMRPNETTADISAKDIVSQARLVLSVYKGKSTTLLIRKSVFPVLIKKDHLRDRRSLLIDMEQLKNATMAMPPMDENKNDVHHEQHDHSNGDDNSAPDAPTDAIAGEGEGEGGEGEEEGDDSENAHDGDDEEEREGQDGNDGETNIDGNDDDGGDGEDDNDDDDLEQDTPPAPSTEHDDMSPHDGGHDGMEEQPQQEHDHEHGLDHEHDPSHVIDPNHFQNDEDIRIWKEHEDEPGWQAPIKVEQAGTIQITRWIDNKERFFVGAPYVMAWEFPEDAAAEGLTGFVNVYVENAETAKRVDVVAGNLPSSVLFIYMHPTEVMLSADPTKRIVLRARVEMDLMKDGNFRRYTAFSKPFWVERGAL